MPSWAFGQLSHSNFMAPTLILCEVGDRLSLSYLFRSYPGKQARLLWFIEIPGGCRILEGFVFLGCIHRLSLELQVPGVLLKY